MIRISRKTRMKFFQFVPAFFIVALMMFVNGSSLYAIDIQLTGEPTLISGNKNYTGMWRFPTSTQVDGEMIDLILEVTGTNNGYNELTGSHVTWESGINAIGLWTANAGCDMGTNPKEDWMDLKATLVARGTYDPVTVDRLVLSGFDVDGYETMYGSVYRDYILVADADASFIDSESKLQTVTINQGGTNGVVYTQKLISHDEDCNDSIVDPTCNGSFVFKNTSEIYFRVFTTATHARLYGLTFSEEPLLMYHFSKDYGDAPESYGEAYHDINQSFYLGKAFADSEEAMQYSEGADADDSTAEAGIDFDDDDGVYLNGEDLQNQRVRRGQELHFQIQKTGNGYLHGWIDWNADGRFDTDEKMIDALSSDQLDANVTVTVPSNAKETVTYARFRYSDQSVLSANGDGGKGEVEDYRLFIDPFCVSPLLARSKQGKVQLVWSENDEANYELYRSHAEEGYKLVSSGLQGIYTDTDIVPNETYRYRVKRLDGDSNQSCYSAGVSVFAPAKRMRMTSVPDLFDVEINEAGTLLQANTLELGSVETLQNPMVRINHISSHEPEVNSFLPLNTRVDLFVSDNEWGSNLKNTKPFFTSEPATTLTYLYYKYSYTYYITAKDYDDDNLTFKLLEGGNNMVLSQQALKYNGEWRVALTWTPPSDFKGFQNVSVEVSDDKGGATVQRWNIRVDYPTWYDDNNTVPVIHSTPVLAATHGKWYEYEVNATDAETALLIYEVVYGPPGMTFSGKTLQWYGKLDYENKKSVFDVEIMVRDCRGGIARQSWQIDVNGTNLPPVITSVPKIEAKEGTTYFYQVVSSDPEGGFLYRPVLLKGPEGMYVRTNSADLRWLPTAEQAGSHNVSIRVADLQGAYVDQNWTINVVPNQPPVITSTPPTEANVGSMYWYSSYSAIDPDGDHLQKLVLLKSPEGMTIPQYGGPPRWVPTEDQVGAHEVAIRLADYRGAYVDQNWTINVAPNRPPVITSTPPTEAKAGLYYRYIGYAAIDPDGDNLKKPELIKGPDGMTIPQYGGAYPSWKPTDDQAGAHEVAIRTTDARGAYVDQNWTINVVPNQPPVITSTPPTEATPGVYYRYSYYSVSDTDGDNLNKPVLLKGPEGMTIAQYGGSYPYWMPTDDQIGSHEVAIRVIDARGAYVDQNWTINVGTPAANHPPVILSTPNTIVQTGNTYSYAIDASDSDADALEYTLVTAPDGMTLDGRELGWVPVPAQEGWQDVVVKVSDLNGSSVSQQWRIAVVSDGTSNQPPIIDSSPVVLTQTDTLYEYQLHAFDPESGMLAYKLNSAPLGMEIDESGLIRWTPVAYQNGPHDINVTVTDQMGASVAQGYRLAVVPDVSKNHPPIIETAPIGEAEINAQYLYDLNATDSDGDALMYYLTQAPSGMTIGAQTGMIKWVPADSQNDYEDIGVIVRDTKGATVSQRYRLAVIRDLASNHTPIIHSSPASMAQIGVAYLYEINATDMDGDTLSYRLDFAPEGMSLNVSTGSLEWTPASEQAGFVDINITVLDPKGAEVKQNWRLGVVENIVGNQPPIIHSVPPNTGNLNTLYLYQVIATDSEAATLLYQLLDAPAGMQIDSESGLISWTPEEDQKEMHHVTLRVSDDSGGSVYQQYYLTVAPERNLAPLITSSPLNIAYTGTQYLYSLVAVDPNGDEVVYTMPVSPEGMQFDPSSGLLSWVPTHAQYGMNKVVLKASDPMGATAEQEWSIAVTVIGNTAPTITSTPNETVHVDTLYNYPVMATDAENDLLSYSLLVYPEGMSIDPNTGVISWTANLMEVGVHEVTVRVVDDKGAYSDQNYQAYVSEVPDRLRVELSLSETIVDVGAIVGIGVETITPYPDTVTVLYVNGKVTPVDASGYASTIAEKSGLYEVTAIATGNDESVETTRYFSVREKADAIAPEAVLHTPNEGTEVVKATEVVVTATDENLAYYRLYLSTANGEDERLVAEGFENVVEGSIATIDSSVLSNGTYLVKLLVVDVNGQVSEASTSIIVSGQAKIGNFSFTVQDFSLDVAGIPVYVNRTYSTLRKFENLDFGHGWSVDYQDVKIEENRVPGSAWKAEAAGGIVPSYCYRPDKAHYITVSLPDGSVETFDFMLTEECGHSPQSFDAVPAFVSRDGSDSTLEAIGAPTMLRVDPDSGILVDIGNVVYNPDRYRLTTYNGYIYELDQEFGITKVIDPNGNNVTYTSSGVTSSFGKKLLFERDGEGRIVKITDPLGNFMSYAYDDYGNLASATDPVGNTTTYEYDDAHTMTVYIDPTGTTVARNVYDDAGRLIMHIDADGNTVEYTHNTGANEEIVYDKLGAMSRFVYDDRGNVLEQTDALGNITIYSYDERGNKLSQTDALGNMTTFVYDEHDNVLSETDALGNSETTTYNDRGYPLAITSKDGNVSTNEYDAVGNPTAMIHPDGSKMTFGYSARGTLASLTDEMNNTVTYTYDANGNKISQTRVEGAVTSYTYDANNNVVEQNVRRTDSEGAVHEIVTRYGYDAKGRKVLTTYHDGTTEKTEYNARGKVSAETARDGRRTEFEYDARANLVLTRYSDGTEETYSYDANNNKTSETDREGRTTYYEYDALNRLVKTIHPDGTFTRSVYDAAGNIIESIDAGGNSTYYEYDELNRQVKITDAMGNIMRFVYDVNGNRIEAVDANGNTTAFEYDSQNRNVRIRYPDGSVKTNGYNLKGLPTGVTDELGNTTSYRYDGESRLVEVIDALGNTTSYSYDELGNKTSQSDANDHTTRWEYDDEGRLIRHALPMGQSESYSYDAKGNMSSHTDFNGRTTYYSYDENNRLIEENYEDGLNYMYTHTLSGKLSSVTDSRGTTTYVYDLIGRLLYEEQGDGTYIAYGYDEAGNRNALYTDERTVEYTYDALNRLTGVTENGETTTYGYDALGNQNEIAYPNGTKTLYGYDRRNRVTDVSHYNADASLIERFDYTYDSAGNRTRIVQNNGRITDYTYDDLNRLTGESITNDPQGNDYTTIYAYDKTGNRTQKSTNGTTTTYSYNANDQLISDGTRSYGYDDNGNLLSKGGQNYMYDDRDRLIHYSDAADNATYQYDHANNRTEKTVNSDTTTYLVDANLPYAQVIRESNATNNISYTYGNDLIQRASGSDTYFYHYDALGSTRYLTDQNAQTKASYYYDAYGNLLNHDQSTANNYLYAGEQFDEESENYYLRARYLDTKDGRFLTTDPFEGRMAEPITLNDYIYAGNNPVLFVDPSGEALTVPQLALGITALAALSTVATYNFAQKSTNNSNSEDVFINISLYELKSILSAEMCPAFWMAGIVLTPQQEKMKDMGHSKYRNKCRPTPSESNFSSKCAYLGSEIKRIQECIRAYESLDKNYHPGRHAKKIQDWQNRVKKFKKDYQRSCSG